VSVSVAGTAPLSSGVGQLPQPLPRVASQLHEFGLPTSAAGLERGDDGGVKLGQGALLAGLGAAVRPEGGGDGEQLRIFHKLIVPYCRAKLTVPWLTGQIELA
jgi:hypothetical protein